MTLHVSQAYSLFGGISLMALHDVASSPSTPPEMAPPTPRQDWNGELSRLGAPDPPTGSAPVHKPLLSQLFQDRAQGRALQTPGLVRPKKTKLGNPPAYRPPPSAATCPASVVGPGTSVWALGTGLPKSRVSGHIGKSFCKQTPWVSSQTGRHTRSASADLTLKIGSQMPV